MIKPLSLSPKPIPSLSSAKPPKALPPIWASKGVGEKPGACKSCAFHQSGSGFVPDFYPDSIKTPKIGFLLDFPSSDDVVSQRPWTGLMGFAWERAFIKPFGLQLHDVAISHIIRCQPKARRFGKAVYPTDKLRRSAELACRSHDSTCWGGPSVRTGGIVPFDPNLFVISFSPKDTLLTPALGRLLKKDIEKALRFSEKGYRPMLLLGVEAKELVAPWLRGPVKAWRGHYWHGEWPWKPGSSMVEPSLGFLEA